MRENLHFSNESYNIPEGPEEHVDEDGLPTNQIVRKIRTIGVKDEKLAEIVEAGILDN